MAWPTLAEVKAQYEKLNEASAYDAKITRAITFATNRVQAALASVYDVAAWAGALTTPPLVYDIALLLVYGYFAPKVHTGASMKPTDEAAKDARDYAEELLKLLIDGDMVLVDSSGGLISRRSSGTGWIHRRTNGAVFTPDAPETWGVVLLTPGDEMV